MPADSSCALCACRSWVAHIVPITSSPSALHLPLFSVVQRTASLATPTPTPPSPHPTTAGAFAAMTCQHLAAVGGSHRLPITLDRGGVCTHFRRPRATQTAIAQTGPRQSRSCAAVRATRRKGAALLGCCRCCRSCPLTTSAQLLLLLPACPPLLLLLHVCRSDGHAIPCLGSAGAHACKIESRSLTTPQTPHCPRHCS